MRIHSSLRSTLVLLTLIAVAGWIYFPPYNSTFLLDDFKHFEFVRDLQPKIDQWWVVFRPDWIGWHYRPIHHLAIMAGMTVFGTNPLPYYLTLLVLHGLVTTCLVMLALRLGYPGWAALATGALFAIAAPHWQVVGWISSLTILTAALFSLLALIALISALQQDDAFQAGWRLAISFVCFLIALCSREETLLLFPLMTWAILTYPGKRWREWKFVAFAAFILAASTMHLHINLTRPTWTFNSDAKFASIAASLFSANNGIAYLEQLLYGYWAISAPLSQFDTMIQVLPLLVVALFTFWFFRRLPWGGKLGLLWGIAAITFIYALTEGGGIGYPQLLPQRAHLAPSDRYLYLPWIGFSLALGASLSQLLPRAKVGLRWSITVTAIVLLLYTGCQAYVVRHRQVLWLPEAYTTQSIEQQLKVLIPDPAPSIHFYAMRATDIPDYFQAMASTWYGHNFPWPGGAVSRLLSRGWATPDDYVFDYEDGVLYELIPELRTSDKTWLLLQQTPQTRLLNEDMTTNQTAGAFTWNPVSVVGPPNERRLGVQLDLAPDIQGWHSLCYTMTLPTQADFRTAVYTAAQEQETETDALLAQVRLVMSDGASTTLWHEPVPGSTTGWFPVEIDLEGHANQSVDLCIEILNVAGRSQVEVAWANPRITTTSSDQ